MTKKELKTIDEIMFMFRKIDDKYKTLSIELQTEIGEVYDNYSPSACIRWGLSAFEEISNEEHERGKDSYK